MKKGLTREPNRVAWVVNQWTIWYYNPNLPSDMDELCLKFWSRLGF